MKAQGVTTWSREDHGLACDIKEPIILTEKGEAIGVFVPLPMWADIQRLIGAVLGR